MSATHGVTPRTDAETFQLYREDVTGCAEAIDYVAASFARTLETELAAAKAECERLRTLNDNAGSALQWAKEELARLRADVERWSGGLDMSLPDLYEAAKSDRDKANAELARLRAELAVAENWVEHHSKHADDLIGENVKLRAEVEQMKDYAFWKDTAQTRAENLERASEQMLVHEQTIARLRAEVEKATAKIANQAERIRYLEGATNHATGTPLSLADARKDSERLREALERLHGVVVSAGITNLSRGVQLGQISWHHKAEDAVASARAAIDAAKGTQ